jgi:hypothetical protein
MIKKITLVVLFALLLAISFYQNQFLNKNGERFVTDIEKIESLINNEDYKNAELYSNKTFNDWMKVKKKYEIFCEHEEVDKIQACFESLLVLVRQNNELSLNECALLKYYLDHIVNIDSFSIENIF